MTRSVLFWIGVWMIVAIVVVIIVWVQSLYVNANAGEISYPLSRQKDVQDIAWEMMHELGWESISGTSMLHPGERVERGIYRAVDGNGKPVAFQFDGRSWTFRGCVRISVAEGSEFTLPEITKNLGGRLDFVGWSPERMPSIPDYVPWVVISIVLGLILLCVVVKPETGMILYPRLRRRKVLEHVRDMIRDIGWESVSESARRGGMTIRAMDGRDKPVVFEFGGAFYGWMQVSVADGSEYSRKEVTMELGRRLGFKKYPPLRPRENESSREQE